MQIQATHSPSFRYILTIETLIPAIRNYIPEEVFTYLYCIGNGMLQFGVLNLAAILFERWWSTIYARSYEHYFKYFHIFGLVISSVCWGSVSGEGRESKRYQKSYYIQVNKFIQNHNKLTFLVGHQLNPCCSNSDSSTNIFRYFGWFP